MLIESQMLQETQDPREVGYPTVPPEEEHCNTAWIRSRLVYNCG